MDDIFSFLFRYAHRVSIFCIQICHFPLYFFKFGSHKQVK